MTGVNNASEGVEEQNKHRKGSMSASTFLSHFSRDYIEKRPNDIKNQLIEEIMTQDTLSGTLASKGLAEFRASDEKYNEVNIDDKNIDIYMLRKHVAKSYLLLKNSKKDFQEHILQNFNISSDNYDSKISSKVEDLGQVDLQRMMSGENELRKFLEKCLGQGSVEPRIDLNIFEGISEAQLQDRLRKIKAPEKEELIVVLGKLQKNQTPSDYEIRSIVESNLLDEKQKIGFVHTFLPFITLKQVEDLGIKTQSQIEKIYNDYVSKIFDETDVSKENKEKLKQQISLSDIRVPTKDLIQSSDDVIKTSQGIGFQGFVDDLQTHNQNLNEQVRAHGPQSFRDMLVSLESINDGNTYQNLEKFSVGNIVKFSKVGPDGQDQIDYIEIFDFDDDKNEFRYKNVGNDSINLKNPGEPTAVAYQDFIEGLKKDSSTRFEVLTRDVIKERIKMGEIKSSSLTVLEESDFIGDENYERRQGIKDQHILELEQEISQLENNFSNASDSEKIKIQQDINSAQNSLSKMKDSEDISPKEAAYFHNRQEFLSKLNEVDPKGSSLGFGPGVTFYTGDKVGEDDFGTYTISSIDYDNWTIHFYSQAKPESVNLTDFFEIFKDKKATRHKGYSNPEQLISESEIFKNHDYKNGEIIAKNAEDGVGNKSDRTVEYLKAKKGKRVIKISSISGAYADVQIGESEDVSLSDKEKARGDKKSKVKINGAETLTWTLDELYRYIKQEELEPDWKVGHTMTIVPKDQQNAIKGSLGNRLVKGFSLADIIAGGKTAIEGITESLNQGSQVKSAKAALAMGKFLPEDLKEDLRSKVESAESEEMDKALKQLGSVDSPIAVGRIKKWLLNKDIPESKKEAGLLFMLDKYGHLTAKGPLAEYRGRFLWYEAFGGRIGDPLYNEIKEQAETSDPPQTFSEEQLMLILLKRQCKLGGFNGIRRRSRLHKEFDGKWKGGIKEELEKGYNDASNYRDVDTIIREALGEAKGGTTSNAIGWMKRIPELGGSLEQMCHVPFALLTSGVSYDIDQATYKHAKALWDGDGQPVIMLRMFGDKAKMDLFNDTVLALSKEIGKAYPNKYPNIEEEAEKLYKESQNREGKEGDRIDAASNFWKKYGTPLARGLHNSLESGTDTSATDTIIKRNAEKNEIFGKYNHLVQEAVGEGNAFNIDIVDDWAGDTGVFGLNTYKISGKFLELVQGGAFKKGSASKKVWKHLYSDINSTPNKLLVGGLELDSSENRIAQKKYIVGQLEEICSGILGVHGGNMKVLPSINAPTGDLGEQFNKWGINFEKDLSYLSSGQLKSGGARRYFENIAENIISGNNNSTQRTPDVLMSQVRERAAKKLNQPQGPSDDEEY